MSSSDTSEHLSIAMAQRETSAQTSAMDLWQRGRRSISFLVILAAGLIALGDVLFYQQTLGWTLALFGLAVVTAVTLRSGRYWHYWSGRIIAVGILLLCLALIEHPGPLRVALALLGIISLAVINARGFTYDVPSWIIRWSEMFSRWCMQLPIDVVHIGKWRNARGPSASPSKRWAINWFIPIALSLVFVGLFAAANPVISNWLSKFGNAVSRVFSNFSEYVSVGRVFLWVLIGFPAWALLRSRIRWSRDRVPEVVRTQNGYQSLISKELLLRCLVVFNVVFAVQLALDMTTVLSQGGTLPEGMTYAEYARRGAYPLVATALLAAAFVLVALPSGPRSNVWVGTRVLVYLWIGQNIVLTGSAVWRLWMYVDVFGLTRLRVAAAIWMLLVTLGLIYIIWRIMAERSNAWLLRINTITLLVVLFACCFVNFDRIIAWEGALNNYELRGEGSPRLDLRYMQRLGIDAIPALEWFATSVGQDDPVGQSAAEHARLIRTEMEGKLQTWHGWTFRRHRIASTPSLMQQ